MNAFCQIWHVVWLENYQIRSNCAARFKVGLKLLEFRRDTIPVDMIPSDFILCILRLQLQLWVMPLRIFLMILPLWDASTHLKDALQCAFPTLHLPITTPAMTWCGKWAATKTLERHTHTCTHQNSIHRETRTHLEDSYKLLLHAVRRGVMQWLRGGWPNHFLIWCPSFFSTVARSADIMV